MKEKHLKNSPIREAVVDFKFSFQEPVDLSMLESAYEKLKSSYPTKEVIDMNSLFFNISAKDKPKIEHTQGKVGYRFISSEKDIIVQFRIDGFTFSKLKPYTSWNEIINKVKEAYMLYTETVKISKVIRIATRYINFIQLEANEKIDIKNYFNIYPSLPSILNGPIDNYLMRISIKDPSGTITSIINQGVVSEQNIQNNEVVKSLVFDIDCFEDKLSIDPANPWSNLEKIKAHTNKTFFDSITTFTKEKFK